MSAKPDGRRLTRDEQKHWLTAYKAYMEAMTQGRRIEEHSRAAADCYGDDDARA